MQYTEGGVLVALWFLPHPRLLFSAPILVGFLKSVDTPEEENCHRDPAFTLSRKADDGTRCIPIARLDAGATHNDTFLLVQKILTATW